MPTRLVTYLTAGAFALIAGIAISLYWAPPSNMPDPKVELTPVIDQPLIDLTGSTRRLREWEGKILLVNFWATWCAPCREEIPLIQQVREQYKDREFEVIGVAIDQEQSVEEYRDALDIEYPLLLVEGDPMGLLSSFGDEQGALPHSAILGRTGEILETHTGPLTYDQLEQLIRAHL